MNLAAFPAKLSLRIDWSEMDLFGHVNNVTFFKYIQASRVNYWETIGLTLFFDETKTGPILASTQCHFKKPLHYPGNINVYARVDHIGTTSFSLTHLIVNEQGEEAAEGKDIVVLFDFKNNTKMPIPSWLRHKIETLEKRTF